MIMRILFLLLVSISSYGQLVNNNILLHSAGRDTVEIPYPFLANSVDNDSIRTEWIDIGADNYVLESDDNDDFSSPTTEYSGTNTSYTLTGLSPGDKYYFRLKAQTAGLVDSPYAIDTCATFPFVPVAHYEIMAIAQEDNIYADHDTGVEYNSFHSVVNYSGPDLVPGTGGANFLGQNWTAYPSYFAAQATPASSIVLNDFEINVLITFNGAAANNEIFDNTGDAAQYIRFNTYSQIRFSRTTGVTLTFTNTMVDGNSYFITFQRSGTTFTAIVRDVNGVTETQSGACPSTAVTFNRFFNVTTSYYVQRINIADHALSTAERDSVFNFFKRKVFVPDPLDTTVHPKGLTYSSFSTNYFANSDFPNVVTTSFTRDKFFGYGPYSIINVQKKYESPTFGEDLVYVLNEVDETISQGIEMGVPDPTSEDIHNTGGICFWNGLLVHFEQSKQHSDGTDNTLVVKMFGKNMNMVGYKQIPLARGIVTYNALDLQYHQAVIINDKIYILAQEDNKRTVLLISNDEWTSFRKYNVMVPNGATDFLYHNLLYSQDKIIITIDHLIDPVNDYHRASYILVMDPFVDELVFYNVAGTFSKNIGTAGHITQTEADANFLLGTALAGTPSSTTSVKQCHGLYDPAANEAYVVRFNGSDDGLILCEVDFTAETITEFDIPEVIDGHTIDVSCIGSGATNQPLVYKDGSTYYLVCGEVNGANTKIIRCSSTDGTTWNYVDQLSGDDTKPHIRIMPTKNWYYTETRSIFASRDQTTYGDLFRYNVSTP